MPTPRSLRPQRPHAANLATEDVQLQRRAQGTVREVSATGRFRLAWDGAPLSFSEATGLDTPGMRVTLNNGHYLGGAFWDWFNRIKSSTMQRMEITISQYNEHGIAVYRWTLHEAWPVLVIAAPGVPLGAPGLSAFVIEHHGVVGEPLMDCAATARSL